MGNKEAEHWDDWVTGFSCFLEAASENVWRNKLIETDFIDRRKDTFKCPRGGGKYDYTVLLF